MFILGCQLDYAKLIRKLFYAPARDGMCHLSMIFFYNKLFCDRICHSSKIFDDLEQQTMGIKSRFTCSRNRYPYVNVDKLYFCSENLEVFNPLVRLNERLLNYLLSIFRSNSIVVDSKKSFYQIVLNSSDCLMFS